MIVDCSQICAETGPAQMRMMKGRQRLNGIALPKPPSSLIVRRFADRRQRLQMAGTTNPPGRHIAASQGTFVMLLRWLKHGSYPHQT